MQGEYIWCYIEKDGTLWPHGHGKTLEYAMSCEERKYPKRYKLFRLVDVCETNKITNERISDLIEMYKGGEQ